KLEIGYSILPKYWGMGYATEAAQKCKDYAFSNNLTDHLISMVFVENEASAKLALKNGMQLEKTIVDFDGMPLQIFGIHKTTWLRSK
ncbi:MAG: GNAT family N-acetyltransferase, partial [Schleiferiaceae bacterium]|nr:GNAT family N-acetyltransferase [Schleiferiaceae bacterium]